MTWHHASSPPDTSRDVWCRTWDGREAVGFLFAGTWYVDGRRNGIGPKQWREIDGR